MGCQQKVENERIYQTAVSDFQDFENFEQVQNKIIFKRGEMFRIQKQNGNVCERTISGGHVYKFSSRYLESDRVLVFCTSKTVIFTLSPAISVFPRFPKFVRLWPFKKCSRVNFRILDEKLTQKQVSRHPNLQFSV